MPTGDETLSAAAKRRQDLAEARRRYAEELRYYANVRSEAVLRAFATVPREGFLGPGPWLIAGFAGGGYWRTDDGDPRHLYHNVLVCVGMTGAPMHQRGKLLATWTG